jgi:hypothetical protein
MDPPQKFTPYVEECVKSLENFGDHPNDKVAVVLVRLQGILERVCIHLASLHIVSRRLYDVLLTIVFKGPPNFVAKETRPC